MFAIAITLVTALAAIIALAVKAKKKKVIRRIKNNQQEFYQIDEIDYSKPANPLDNLRVGKIVWRDGLRYYETKDGSVVRFESSEEPLIIDGKYFTGRSAAGEYFWAEGVKPELKPEKVKPEKVKPEKVKPGISKKKSPAARAKRSSKNAQ